MIEFAMFSDSGNRDNNEDYVGTEILEDNQGGCFVLCDGLGGHGSGEVASKLVVETVLEVYKSAYGKENFISASFQKSQNALMELQRANKMQNAMKTTAIVLQLENNSAKWGYIGDSRLYYFKHNKLIERTMDHSVPQMLVNAGEMKEKEIRHHPDRNRLLRVMGMEWDTDKFVEHENIDINGECAFLLCTDGFWELIEENKMIKCLKHSKGPEEWIGKMRKIIEKNGENADMDNYSAIAVMVRR